MSQNVRVSEGQQTVVDLYPVIQVLAPAESRTEWLKKKSIMVAAERNNKKERRSVEQTADQLFYR